MEKLHQFPKGFLEYVILNILSGFLIFAILFAIGLLVIIKGDFQRWLMIFSVSMLFFTAFTFVLESLFIFFMKVTTKYFISNTGIFLSCWGIKRSLSWQEVCNGMVVEDPLLKKFGLKIIAFEWRDQGNSPSLLLFYWMNSMRSLFASGFTGIYTLFRYPKFFVYFSLPFYQFIDFILAKRNVAVLFVSKEEEFVFEEFISRAKLSQKP